MTRELNLKTMASHTDDLYFPYDTSDIKDRRWDNPDEQAALVGTTKRLVINDTKDLTSFAALMSPEARARTIDELAQIAEYVNGLIREINQHNS